MKIAELMERLQRHQRLHGDDIEIHMITETDEAQVEQVVHEVYFHERDHCIKLLPKGF